MLINEYLGERSILTLKNGNQTLQALAPPETRITPGERAGFRLDPRDVMIFDAETEALVA